MITLHSQLGKLYGFCTHTHKEIQRERERRESMATKCGEDVLPLFETRKARGRAAHRLYCSTVLVGVVLIWVYRLTHIPGSGQPGRYAWIGMFFAELLFGIYWVFTQAARLYVVVRRPFKDRLSNRFHFTPVSSSQLQKKEKLQFLLIQLQFYQSCNKGGKQSALF